MERGRLEGTGTVNTRIFLGIDRLGETVPVDSIVQPIKAFCFK